MRGYYTNRNGHKVQANLAVCPVDVRYAPVSPEEVEKQFRPLVIALTVFFGVVGNQEHRLLILVFWRAAGEGSRPEERGPVKLELRGRKKKKRAGRVGHDPLPYLLGFHCLIPPKTPEIHGRRCL